MSAFSVNCQLHGKKEIVIYFQIFNLIKTLLDNGNEFQYSISFDDFMLSCSPDIYKNLFNLAANMGQQVYNRIDNTR